MNPELGPVIARRTYLGARGTDRPVVVDVEIGAPIRSQHSEDEFMCTFHVTGHGFDRVETVYGVDALQALLLALGYLEAVLQRLDGAAGLSLRWLGGEPQDFGIRIPKFSPEDPPPPKAGGADTQ